MKTLNAVGQMLPAVGVGLITGGAGLAAGTSTEEAFNDGADYYKGLGYGMASGAVEMATEKMSGGALKGIIGKGMLDGVGKVAATGAKRVLKNAVEEGAEEVVSELANPALKSIYKGKEAFEEYRDADYWKGVAEAGLVGGATSVVYGGTVGKVLAKTGHGYVGKEADIADSLSEISTLQEKANKLQANGELSATNEQKIADTTRRNYKNIEKVLQGVSEDKRAQYIKKFGLEKAFNTDGSMSGQMSAWFNSFGGQNNLSQNERVSLKKDSYSFNLRGQEQSIQSDLDTISEDRANTYLEDERKKGNEISVEQAREAVGKFRVFSGEMSDMAKAAKNQFNKALNYLNKESGANVSFVITENNKSFNGLLYDDKIYIGEDQFENGTWAGTLVHEYTHLSEDSDEYRKFVDFVATNNFMVDDGKGGKIELWKKGQESVLGKGYVDGEIISETLDKIANNEQLTAEEQKQFKTFMSEVRAHEAEYLLGNEEFIDGIVAKESSFAQKFVKKIEDLKKAFERIGDKSARQAHKQLLTAEKLWLKAAYKAGDMKLARYILARSPELEKEVDFDAQIVYNKKNKKKRTYYSQYNTMAMQWAFSSKTKPGDIKVLYNPQNNTWNKLIADDTGERYGTLLSIKDTQENAEAIRNLHDEVYNENHGKEQRDGEGLRKDYEKYWSLSNNFGDDNFDVEEQDANERSREVHRGESESDGIGYSRKGDRNQPIKYSLKTAKYIPYDKVGSDNIRAIKKKLNDLYQGIDDAVADGIAIENGDTIYVVDSGKDNGDIRFGIRRKIRIEDNDRRKEYIRNINKESEENDFGDRTIFERTRINLGNDSGLNVGQQYRENLPTSKRKSDDYERGTSTRNGSRGVQVLKYSLKTDSDGRQLSEGQKEFFKDSKVVDEQGRLLVVYHGTKAVFTEFDRAKVGLNGSQEGQGIYFTDNKDFAEGYSDEKGQLLEGYLNIKKPLSDSERTLTKKQVESIIRKLDHSGDELLSNYSTDSRYYGTAKHEMWYESALRETLDSVMKYCDTDSEIMAELSNAGAGSENVLKVLFDEFGYDGYIVKGKYKDTNVYVAFDSSQFKNADNRIPTGSKDIRYSLKPFSEQVDDVLTGEHDSDYVDIRFSLKEDAAGKYVSVNLDAENQIVLGKLDIQERRKFVKDYIKNTFRNIKFVLQDGKVVIITGTGAGKISESSYLPKQRTALEMEDLFKVTEYLSTVENPNHKKFVRFDYYKARVELDGTYYSCVLNFGVTRDGGLYQLYDVNQFREIKKDTPTELNLQQGSTKSMRPISNVSFSSNISNNIINVNSKIENSEKIKYSVKETDVWKGLTKQEQAQLYQRIDALHHSKYTERRLNNGNYILDVENKIIETNGEFDSPSVEGYVEFNKYSSKISIARDYFYEQVNNGRTVRESVENINDVCEEEVATLHGYGDSKNNRIFGEQGRNDNENRANSERDGRGRKGTQSDAKAVRYDFEAREITYSDGTTAKFSLKETDESVRKYAQNNAEKVYGKSDAREVLKRVCACLEFDDGSYGDISGHKEKTVDMLYDAFNTKPEGERYKVALDIADYILSNVTLGNIYADEEREKVA